MWAQIYITRLEFLREQDAVWQTYWCLHPGQMPFCSGNQLCCECFLVFTWVTCRGPAFRNCISGISLTSWILIYVSISPSLPIYLLFKNRFLRDIWHLKNDIHLNYKILYVLWYAYTHATSTTIKKVCKSNNLTSVLFSFSNSSILLLPTPKTCPARTNLYVTLHYFASSRIYKNWIIMYVLYFFTFTQCNLVIHPYCESQAFMTLLLSSISSIIINAYTPVHSSTHLLIYIRTVSSF